MFKKIYQLDESSYMTLDEIKKLLQYCENDIESMLIKTLFFLAARVSEIVGLKGVDALIPSRVDNEKGVIILRNLKAKKGVIRWKTLNPPEVYMNELHNFIQKYNIPSNAPIFNMSRFQAYRVIRKVGKLSGFEFVGKKYIQPRTFRHSFVMHGVINDVPSKFLQKQTGHTTEEMLGHYKSLKPKDIEDSKKKMWNETNL